MTGVDTMTSSTSFGHAMGPNGNPGQVQTQANSAGQPAINHITMKAKDEVIASLHLIKDIRRLETYQRDFFLKVSETQPRVLTATLILFTTSALAFRRSRSP